MHQQNKKQEKILPNVIAIVGCDGSGKSTLSADLMQYLQQKGPTFRRYLGLISGEKGDKIKKVPLIGQWLEVYLKRKAERAQDMKKKIPGPGTALIMYLLSWWRAWHVLKLARLSQRGGAIIVDRYPQAEIPGFHYDGPGLSGERETSWFISMLARHEQRLYQWMAQYKPALVIRLNVDIETAFSRKPDHDKAELAEKIDIMPKLQFNGTKIVDIDSRHPYPDVLQQAISAVDQVLAFSQTRGHQQ